MNSSTYYKNLKTALKLLCDYLLRSEEHILYIPKLGCGIDGCSWDRVSQIIQDVFKNTSIKITVCVKPKIEV